MLGFSKWSFDHDHDTIFIINFSGSKLADISKMASNFNNFKSNMD
jgi:hypothetical protein